jgi:hypothetical protein
LETQVLCVCMCVRRSADDDKEDVKEESDTKARSKESGYHSLLPANPCPKFCDLSSALCLIFLRFYPLVLIPLFFCPASLHTSRPLVLFFDSDVATHSPPPFMLPPNTFAFSRGKPSGRRGVAVGGGTGEEGAVGGGKGEAPGVEAGGGLGRRSGRTRR